MLDIRVFANSSWTSCVPVLEIRHFVFRKFPLKGIFKESKKNIWYWCNIHKNDNKNVFSSLWGLWGHKSSKIIVNYMYYIATTSGKILKQLFRNSSFFAIRHNPWRRINDEFRGIPVLRITVTLEKYISGRAIGRFMTDTAFRDQLTDMQYTLYLCLD